MPMLSWNDTGKRFFETGVDRGVLYPTSGPGVAWSGLISVEESSSGGDATPYYQDGIKQVNTAGAEDFEATIEAYTYPKEFAECEGVVTFGKGLSIDKQPRKPFGLSYRTLIGNDIDGTSHGYKLHIVYNALVSPTSKSYETLGDRADASSFSWPISTTPVVVEGRKASAHFVIDSTETDPYLLAAVEEILYGTGTAEASLPSATQFVTLFRDWLTLNVIDNGDGTWTASGPEPVVHFTSETEFEISWHSANPITEDSYTVSSG